MNRFVKSLASSNRVLALAALVLAGLLATGCYTTDPNPKQPFVFPGTTTVTSPGNSNPGSPDVDPTLVPPSTTELRPGETITVSFVGSAAGEGGAAIGRANRR